LFIGGSNHLHCHQNTGTRTPLLKGMVFAAALPSIIPKWDAAASQLPVLS
jgi:hypothetical protein